MAMLAELKTAAEDETEDHPGESAQTLSPATVMGCKADFQVSVLNTNSSPMKNSSASTNDISVAPVSSKHGRRHSSKAAHRAFVTNHAESS